MTIFHKKSAFVLFSGIFYAFSITVLALIFSCIGTGLLPYAAKELIFVASEITTFAIIFSFFTEIFIRRFEG